MLLLFTLIYDFTVGPVCYSLVAEVSSTRLKAKTIVLARNFYNVGGIIVNVLTTYQLTPSHQGGGGERSQHSSGLDFVSFVSFGFFLASLNRRGELTEKWMFSLQEVSRRASSRRRNLISSVVIISYR